MEKQIFYKADNTDSVKLVENDNELTFYMTNKEKSTKISVKYNDNKTFNIIINDDTHKAFDNLSLEALTNRNELINTGETLINNVYDGREIMSYIDKMGPEDFCDSLDVDENGKIFLEVELEMQTRNKVYEFLTKELSKDDVTSFYCLISCYLEQNANPFNRGDFKQTIDPAVRKGSGKKPSVCRWGRSRRDIILVF